jgi:hypothetical protein
MVQPHIVDSRPAADSDGKSIHRKGEGNDDYGRQIHPILSIAADSELNSSDFICLEQYSTDGF